MDIETKRLLDAFTESLGYTLVNTVEFKFMKSKLEELSKHESPKESDYDKLLSKIDYIACGVLDDTLPIYQFKTQMINLKTQLELHKSYFSTQYKGSE